ncbi:ornithine cyclodeaminase family protein [Pontivivens insulae]|uniref:Delta(1)-pyrroline-2-carboxylate reductase n=1 Tax=Pontivivens insulae TaxID=1639689 RepID=A0A2R8ADF4_9RHOB|nr:ornithine cyclodeaminase [Pontivivens insulae]RED14014.1 ornithine cyclodeaminase [Pontivivens insulae]SPF30088.1 Delta(1)-pyrroline-2-carboxylate reductase [Pontivivens insulae]
MANLPFITASDVPPADWVAIADAIEEGHRGPAPEVSDQFLHRGDDTLLSRAAWIDGAGVGVKSVTVLPGNPAQGRPSVQGAMLVFDDQTGAPRAVIDNALITRWKTAGDSVLGARLLARPDAERLLIIGAGAVADSLIEAYRAVFPNLKTVMLWNRTIERAEALAGKHADVIVAADLSDAVAAADIVATCTMSKSPVLKGDWLAQGAHLDLIGAFTADMREADDTALTRSSIFVDSRETTMGHIGELMIPLASGAIAPSDVKGDLTQIIAGQAGRRSDQEITLFKNGGGAHLDLMTAGVILRAAGL